MCVDANAGARNAARQRWMEKDAKYRSESLKFFNREASAIVSKDQQNREFSKAISNDYQRARYVQGQAYRAMEAGYISSFQDKGSVDEGGRARRGKSGRTATQQKTFLSLMRAQGKLEAAAAYEYGPQMKRRFEARKYRLQAEQAKSRVALGVRPEYGAPVLMPPSDRLSGALSIASSIASIAAAPVGADSKSLFQVLRGG